jgi:hypothetical protein
MATVPGKTSATLDRFLAHGAGAHILALEVDDEGTAFERLRRAGIRAGIETTEREADQPGSKVRFALILPPDPPEGRMLLIRHLTRDLLWRPDNVVHPNNAVALTEVVYASASPAETMTRLSRLAGRPAEPDPLGGYRIPLARGVVRVLPRDATAVLFPGVTGGAQLFGLTISVEVPNKVAGSLRGQTHRAPPSATTTAGKAIENGTANGLTVAAGGVAIRFVAVSG